jgi:enoyl-CoA hydratase/carnithine racemase
MEQHLDSPVLVEQLRTTGGPLIAFARLNAEKTLNSLTLEMVDALYEKLFAWAHDPDIVVVVLEAAGDKAFCAGADLHRLHRSMREHHASSERGDIRANAYALDFLSHEYRLDYLIHTYPKPVLCWGHGIVMGGGVGLMSGASHRVVTERSRVAMPEVTIGLYPDVGGSKLLGNLPGNLGVFLALTGANLNASDALHAGLADYAIRQADKPQVIDALLRMPWSDSRAENDQRLTDALRSVSIAQHDAGPAQRHEETINNVCSFSAPLEIITAVLELRSEDPWLVEAVATLEAGSPSSARLGLAMQAAAKDQSLAEVFRMELIASMHCAARPDLAEGIRALLIDKDRRPRWSPAEHTDVTATWIDGCFASPWAPEQHPLADLAPAVRSP